MGKIVLLDELTTCKIAAGEVIERPASVVKEMTENSIDAGAKNITVEIRNGGIKYIKISDDGSGIERDDAEIAFDKHATSKIRCADDLETVATLGFRGEALASIAAVADVELTSKTENAETAVYVHIQGGKILDVSEKGAKKGTTFIVRDLFYNTPARYKFLKKDSTEARYIEEALEKLALAHPEVSVRLISNNEEILRTPGNGDLKSAIYSIYGRKTAEALREVSYNDGGVLVSGYVAVGEACTGTRSRQLFFVNGRCIKSKTITAALDEGLKSFVMKGKFAFAVLSIEVNPYAVDVNVHPAKTEVRFADESSVFRAVVKAMPYSDGINRIEETAPEATTTAEEETKVTTSFDIPVVKPGTQANETFYRKESKRAWTFADHEEERKTEAPVEITISGISQAPTEEEHEEEKAAPAVNRFYLDARVVGEVLGTYIVLEYNGSMFLLDQHAAHERLIYESLKNPSSDVMQTLLAPVTVTLSPVEMERYRECADVIASFGFDAEEFGSDCVIIHGAPSAICGEDIGGAFTALLEKGKNASARDMFDDDKLYTIACKAAVKGNNRLSSFEIDALLKKLAVTDQPGTCPHGRPIVCEFTKYEIEKKFKRVL